MTALMVASYKGHSSVVKALLQAGANINTTEQVVYHPRADSSIIPIEYTNYTHCRSQHLTLQL